MSIRSRFLPLAALLPLLSACASHPVAAVRACPAIGAVAGADRLTQFRGAGHDLTDVLFTARIDDMDAICKPTARGVSMDMRILEIAERGPANHDGKAPLGYFVAVVDPQGHVLARKSFQNTLVFPPNLPRARHIEELEETIPLPDPALSSQYKVYVGFDLTPDQFEYNRRAGTR